MPIMTEENFNTQLQANLMNIRTHIFERVGDSYDQELDHSIQALVDLVHQYRNGLPNGLMDVTHTYPGAVRSQNYLVAQASLMLLLIHDLSLMTTRDPVLTNRLKHFRAEWGKLYSDFFHETPPLTITG